MRSEQMPPDSVNCKSVPLRKAVPKGEVPNWADPTSAYRFISMSPTLTKIFCLVLDARLIHHAVKHKVVDVSSQGASIPFLPTEWHTHALMETLSGERRRGKPVWLLFLDWKKAYDKVPPGMLKAILERLGVPTPLTNLLHHWSTSRTTTLHVNGEPSDPIPTAAGVGQGDIFSCILYSIFVNSLQRYLKSKGIGLSPVPGLDIVLLEFVDDGLAPCTSAEAAQTAVRAVKEWGDAFGHELNLKPHKTCVMYMPPDGRPLKQPADGQSLREANGLPAITMADGTEVHYVDHYKYLGLVVYPDPKATLRCNLQKLIGDISKNHSRFFAYNSTLRKLPQTAVVQILKTVCINNYLLSIVDPTQGNIDILDKALRPVMRTATARLPTSTPVSFLSIESGLPSAPFLLARAMLTHLLQTLHTLHRDAPAAKITGAHVQDTLVGRRLDPSTWVARATAYLDKHRPALQIKLGARGNWGQPSAILGRPVGPGILSPSGRVMLPHASLTPDDITMAARIYAMLHAHQELMDKAQKGGLTCHVTTMSHKPDVTRGPSQFYHDLCLGHEYTLSGLATPARATPMSTIAQGAAGVLLPSTTHYINADHQHALIYGRLGTRQLFHHPGPEVWRLGDAKSKEAMQLVNKGLQCPFCPEVACAYHIINECKHPHLAAAQAALRASATDFLPTLATIICQASDGAPARSPELDPALDTLTTSPLPPDWTTPTGQNALFRLTMVLPWPAAAVDDPSAVHIRAMGTLLDHTIVRSSKRHGVANAWVGWGGKRLYNIVRLWASEVDAHYAAHELPPPLPPCT